ncbi:MAG: tetratricopeptide repeat protein [Blastocatellia bacterium]|nr:tetratricopeptide repeat protein [Blastocatellia bacterium]
MKRFFFCLVLFLFAHLPVRGQEFEIRKYDLSAKVLPEEASVTVQAKLRLVNLSPPNMADNLLLSNEKPRMSFFLNAKARVEKMAVNGAAVPFKTTEDVRNSLLRVHTDITVAIASARELDVEFVYEIPSADRSPALHVSSADAYLLPASFWAPVTHTPYADHGADTAPVSLTVTAPAGLKVVSSGIRKSDGAFEQSMAAQPFFIVGDYEVVTRGGDAFPVEVYAPRGLNEIGKRQAERLAAEAERMIAFYAKYFGVAALAPFRIVATQARQLSTTTSESFSQGREVSFSTVGLMTVDDNLFRRELLDQGTIELMAGAAARAWIDGQVLLRGRGTGMLRDALPIYLTAQYLGDRFGIAQRDAAYERYRRAYTTIARNDAPLLMQSALDRNYTTSVYNKGALVWRLIEKQVGRQTFDAALRASLSRAKVDALSLSGWWLPQQGRAAAQQHPLCFLSRCANFKENLIAAGADRKLVAEIFSNWIETVSLPDFAIGQPQNTANGVESTIANFGTGDFTVDVLATRENGEPLRQKATVKASEYGTVIFPAGTVIKSIEVDPDNLFLQADYTNDQFPRTASQSEAFGLANVAYSKNDFATAEARAREGLAATPNASTLQAMLGRALLAQKKNEEAAKLFEAALKSEPLPIQAYGWAHQGLAEIALQANNHAEAIRHYRFAAAADLDAATTIAARDGAQKAERAANAIQIPEDIKAFLLKFDAAVLQGQAAAVNPFVELGNLRKFAQSIVVRKPSVWSTEALRSEVWDANRTAVDVSLKIKIEGRDYAGRALYVVTRAGGKVTLSEVPVFDVK